MFNVKKSQVEKKTPENNKVLSFFKTSFDFLIDKNRFFASGFKTFFAKLVLFMAVRHDVKIADNLVVVKVLEYAIKLAELWCFVYLKHKGTL